ncbi:MAG: hypothetical protein RL282_794 [Bacteroidota bacterium]
MRAVQQKANRPNSGKKPIAPVTQKLDRQDASHANSANRIQHQKNQDDANESKSVKQLMAVQDFLDKSAVVSKNTNFGDSLQAKKKESDIDQSTSEDTNITQLSEEENVDRDALMEDFEASENETLANEALEDETSEDETLANEAMEDETPENETSAEEESKAEESKAEESNNEELKTARSNAIEGVSSALDLKDQVKIEMAPEIVQENAKKVKGLLSWIMSIDFKSIPKINFISKYFNILEAIDIFGVTNVLKSIGSFIFAKKENFKIQVLKKQAALAERVPAFPEELMQIAKYALAKVSRSFYTAMAHGVLEALQAVTRIITIATGGITGIFTESINLAAKIIQKAEKAYRMVKGVFKFFKGTRGVARKQNAERIFSLCAMGNTHALNFMQDFFKTGFLLFRKKAESYITKVQDADSRSILEECLENKNDMTKCFKLLKEHEGKPEIKVVKNMFIDGIAFQFKSQPPSGASTLFNLLINQEAVQNGMSDIFEATTSS